MEATRRSPETTHRLHLALFAAGLAAGVAVLALEPAGSVAAWPLWSLVTLGFVASRLYPIGIHLGRDSVTVPGAELFVAMGLVVLSPAQTVAAAGAGWAVGGALSGRGPFAVRGVPMPPRRLLGQAGAVMLAATAGVLAAQAAAPTDAAAGILVALVVFAVVHTVVGLWVTERSLRETADRAVQVRAVLRPLLMVTAPMVVAGVLVGMLATGQPAHRHLVILGVTALYIVVTHLLLSTTLRRDAYAGLIEVAAVPDDMPVEQVIAGIEAAARRLLHQDRVAVSEWPEEVAAGQVSLGELAGHPYWLVASPGDGSRRLRGSQLRLMQELATVASTALRNVMLRAELQRQASRDLLTGLLNRRALSERFDSLVAQCQRSGDQLTLLYLDLDNFKTVNDDHGHDVGDEVLKEFAERLTDTVRTGDVVARIGGDEFVVLLTGMRTTVEVNAAVRRIAAACAHPVSCDPTGEVTCSVGSAMLGHDGDTLDDLLQQADGGMYRDKQRYKHAPGATRSER